MSSRRGASGLSGILLVDKPSGLTSHDVVSRVRRATGERRVGHAGTLDPLATGLLVVLVGPATRLAPYLTAAEKTYVARITFGSETDTDDAEGVTTRDAVVPATLFDPETAEQAVAALVGVHEQMPPAYSAIKRGGIVAYEAARKGEALDLEARTVEITHAHLLGIDVDTRTWEVELSVSKGTYVRAIARDLGRSLGSAAHLAALRRTRSGAVEVADALALEAIEQAADPAEVAARFADPVVAVGLPVLQLSADEAARVATGAALDPAQLRPAAGQTPGPFALAREGTLLGVYAMRDGMLRALAVIPGGVRGGEQ